MLHLRKCKMQSFETNKNNFNNNLYLHEQNYGLLQCEKAMFLLLLTLLSTK